MLIYQSKITKKTVLAIFKADYFPLEHVMEGIIFVF